jgi:Family of unknown function (DUF6165)
VTVMIDVSPAELFDRIAILEIKADRISDPDKVRNVLAELAGLAEVRDRWITDADRIGDSLADLTAVNATLFVAIEAMGQCERSGDFGQEFVELARTVYRENDRRAAIKRMINERLDSAIIEEKTYAHT